MVSLRNRRRRVGLAGGTIAGAGSIRGQPAAEGTVVFENQTTDGTSTVVAELSSEIDATLLARNQDRDECEEKRLKPDFIG